MPILKSGDQFADVDFGLLARHLALLDTELTRLNKAIAASSDPDSDGLFDSGEYFIGHGFIAMQRYLTATRAGLRMTASEAYCLPPATARGISVVAAINAGANYWKHMEEWFEDLGRSADAELKGSALNTLRQLEAITPWREYTCSNLLAILLDGEDLKLSLLLPRIEEWRSNIFDRSQSKRAGL